MEEKQEIYGRMEVLKESQRGLFTQLTGNILSPLQIVLALSEKICFFLFICVN